MIQIEEEDIFVLFLSIKGVFYIMLERITAIRSQDQLPDEQWVAGALEYRTSHGSVSLPLLFALSDRHIPEVDAVETLHSIKLKELEDGKWCAEIGIEESRKKITLPLEREAVWDLLRQHQIKGIDFED